jgi:hypothetical protein
MLKIIFNVDQKWCTLDKEKGRLEKTIVCSNGLSVLNMQKDY